MLAYVAIETFRWTPPQRIMRAEWPEIDLKGRTIEVKGVKAKTRQRRNREHFRRTFRLAGDLSEDAAPRRRAETKTYAANV